MNPTDPHDLNGTNAASPAAPGDDPQAGLSEQGQEPRQEPAPEGAAEARTAGRAAVWLPVHRDRLHRWRRRALPRLAQLTTDSERGVPGLLRAVLLAGAIAAAPWLRCCAGSPRWGRFGAAISDRLLSRPARLMAVAALAAATMLQPGGAAGLALLAAPVGASVLLWARTKFRHSTFARTRARFGVDSWADFWELHPRVSAHAVRGVAITDRPSLAGALPVVPARHQAGSVAVAWQRPRRAALIERLPVTECGTWLGRSAVGPWWGVPCYGAFPRHRRVDRLAADRQETAPMTHHR